jgi:hypothetical protein
MPTLKPKTWLKRGAAGLLTALIGDDPAHKNGASFMWETR